MIHISQSPNPAETYYAALTGIVAGPILFGDYSDAVVYSERSGRDVLSEQRGPYYENHCFNWQLKAEVAMQQSLSGFTPAPTSTLPNRVIRNGVYFDGVMTAGGLIRTNDGARTYYYTGSVSGSSSTYFTCRAAQGNGKVDMVSIRVHDRYAIYSGSKVSYYSSYVTHTLGAGEIDYLDFNTATAGEVVAICEKYLDPVPTGTSKNIVARYDNSTSGGSVVGALSAIESAVWKMQTTPFSVEPVPFGDLANSASGKFAATSVNLLAFIRDIENPITMARKLLMLRGLKRGASAYLATHYGVLPTISDLKKLWEAARRARSYVDRNGFRTSSSGVILYDMVDDVHHAMEQHLKIAVENEDEGLIQLLDSFENIGALPTLENLWDLIPFSFVLDWFVDCGGFLERVDSKARLMRHKIRYVVKSIKRTSTVSLIATPSSPYSGSVQIIDYWRVPSYQCPLPQLTFSQPESPSSHWLEGTALIVQRRK